jgi:hypothetical protein
MWLNPQKDKIALLKTDIDVHTLGISTIQEILEECGFTVCVADEKLSEVLMFLGDDNNASYFIKWLISNKITVVSFSYRLDPRDGVLFFKQMYNVIWQHNMLVENGGQIKFCCFAGLPIACQMVKMEFQESIVVFEGDEKVIDSLKKFKINPDKAPKSLVEIDKYDTFLEKFGFSIINSGDYRLISGVDRSSTRKFGTENEFVVDRIYNGRIKGLPPLIRVHAGPYNSERKDAIKEFIEWIKVFRNEGLLDVLSLGTSQLSQSMFGKEWGDMPNGGGLPISSEDEYYELYKNGHPMLFRTYAGTINMSVLAKVHERSMNIAWHALSLWWFSELDGRGPYSVLENLEESIKALKYIALSNKPYEPNVGHHFSFRGGDDITYVLSIVLAARLAKSIGIKDFIVQIMLNTPKQTWGIMDLAKARATMELVRELEDSNFHVFLQTRAGLDYFNHDLDKAKCQLASVTALMDDIEPCNNVSPDIIHVVSYSEAAFLATPQVINESIKITRRALECYRIMKKGKQFELPYSAEAIYERQIYLKNGVKALLTLIEKEIVNPYSPKGLFQIFQAGFLPVPDLRYCREKYPYAVNWKTKIKNGAVDCYFLEKRMSIEQRIDVLQYNLRQIR